MLDWLQSGAIYQVFTPRWQGYQKEGQVLRQLQDVPWKNLLELGFNVVYLLGVWDSRGQLLVREEEGHRLDDEKRVPSMMAIRDHTHPHPWLGNLEDLQKLIRTLHEQGLRVIVDFVPNHTSCDHPWIKEHPEYYVYEHGAVLREFSGDVAKLDYAKPQVRREMMNVLQRIAHIGFDGVRCDMAHLIPDEFWEEAIASVKSGNSQFRFIAEAYSGSMFDYSAQRNLLAAGFDAVYDQGFYKNLEEVLVNKKSVSYLVEHLKFVQSSLATQVIHYMGNHDDPPLGNRLWGGIQEREESFEKYAKVALGLLMGTSPGIPLVFNGSLAGYPRRLAHHVSEMLPLGYQEPSAGLQTPTKSLLQAIHRLKGQFGKLHFDYTVLQSMVIADGFTANQPACRMAFNLGDSDMSTGDAAWRGREIYRTNIGHQFLKPGELVIFTL